MVLDALSKLDPAETVSALDLCSSAEFGLLEHELGSPRRGVLRGMILMGHDERGIETVPDQQVGGAVQHSFADVTNPSGQVRKLTSAKQSQCWMV
jgi:hypothetical protein